MPMSCDWKNAKTKIVKSYLDQALLKLDTTELCNELLALDKEGFKIVDVQQVNTNFIIKYAAVLSVNGLDEQNIGEYVKHLLETKPHGY